jgi:hypothetical protein
VPHQATKKVKTVKYRPPGELNCAASSTSRGEPTFFSRSHDAMIRVCDSTVGDKLAVRYNPANPDENRDLTEDFLQGGTTSFIRYIIIGAALYYWLKWILRSEKTLPCVKHQDRRTKKRFYHWVENGRYIMWLITVLAVTNALPNCRSCTTLMGVASFCTSRSRKSFSV